MSPMMLLSASCAAFAKSVVLVEQLKSANPTAHGLSIDFVVCNAGVVFANARRVV